MKDVLLALLHLAVMTATLCGPGALLHEYPVGVGRFGPHKSFPIQK